MFRKECPDCYWYEDNGLEGEDAAFACSSPEWEWTEEETRKWRKESAGKEFAVRNSLPEFDVQKHCDFKPLVDGKSYIDVAFGR